MSRVITTDDRNPMTFQPGKRYLAADIHDVVGGQQQYYLSTHDGTIVAAKLRRAMNPDAPEVVLVGQGPVIYANAAIAAAQDEPFPVFLAEDAKPGFVYVDVFVGAGLSEDPVVLGHYSRRSTRDDLRAVCFLKRVG